MRRGSFLGVLSLTGCLWVAGVADFQVRADAGVDSEAPPSPIYGDLTQATRWMTLDVSSLDATLGGFSGGVFDGRYVYSVPFAYDFPALDGVVGRYDTRAPFDALGSWTSFNLASGDARAQGLSG